MNYKILKDSDSAHNIRKYFSELYKRKHATLKVQLISQRKQENHVNYRATAEICSCSQNVKKTVFCRNKYCV